LTIIAEGLIAGAAFSAFFLLAWLVASAVRDARWRRRCVLLALIMERDDYALGLIKRASENGVILWPQQVYPTLRQLEREGAIESYEVAGPPARGGRPRIYYRYKSLMRALLGVDAIEGAQP
jgi:hypothetical protein